MTLNTELTLNIEPVYLCIVAECLVVGKISVNMADCRHTSLLEFELDSSDLQSADEWPLVSKCSRSNCSKRGLQPKCLEKAKHEGKT